MLKDITIGQHFPGDSIVHRTDPRLKILLVIAYIVLLFTINNFLGLALSLVLLAGLYMLAKIPLRIIVKSLKPIIPIIAFTAILNLFFMGGEGEPLLHFWVIKVYKEGIAYAIFMAVRIVALIAGTGLLTYTTSPIVLTDAIERLLSPFAKLGLPVHELAMMMTIALRFIPTLIEETDKIMNAQKARGAMLDRAGQGAGAGADPAVHLGLPPGGRAGHGHGVPVLPGRRGPYPPEGAQISAPRLGHRGLLRRHLRSGVGHPLCDAGGAVTP